MKFLGWIPREEVWGMLEQCHVLLHPCLHDLVTTAYLEAMAARRPVISVGIHPRTQMPFPRDMGVRVLGLSPEVVVKNMATAIQELAANKILREQIGQAERDFVEGVFMWERKASMLESIYLKVSKLRMGEPVACNDVNVFTTFR